MSRKNSKIKVLRQANTKFDAKHLRAETLRVNDCEATSLMAKRLQWIFYSISNERNINNMHDCVEICSLSKPDRPFYCPGNRLICIAISQRRQRMQTIPFRFFACICVQKNYLFVQPPHPFQKTRKFVKIVSRSRLIGKLKALLISDLKHSVC